MNNKKEVKKQDTKALLVKLHDASKTATISDIAKATQQVQASATDKATRAVRIYDIENSKMTALERRFYMNKTIDSDHSKVFHTTVFKNKSDKSSMTSQVKRMIARFLLNNRTTEHYTKEIIAYCQTFGSSYGDIPRSALKQLAAQKLITLRKELSDERSSTFRYKFAVNSANKDAIASLEAYAK